MSCPSCFSGSLHAGTPRGTTETVHSLPTYVARPPFPAVSKAAIVLIPDAFGHDLPNTRVLADAYATRLSATVYVPDFMGGWNVPHGTLGSMRTVTDANASLISRIPAALHALRAIIPFALFVRARRVAPTIYAYMRALRAESDLPLGVAGFCWGGMWAIGLAGGDGVDESHADKRPLVDAAFAAHPSGSMLSIPRDFERIKTPFSLAVGTKDYLLTDPQVKEIQRVFAHKEECGIRVYEGAEHGFAIRGDLGDERKVRQGVEAQDQAVEFFGRVLV